MAEWIEWKGGKCPVNEGVRVEVRLRSGNVGQDFAEVWWWGHCEQHKRGDIVAYRVITPEVQQEPASPWQTIETAPKDGTWVLLWWEWSVPSAGVGAWMRPSSDYVQHWCRNGNWTPGSDPTHWMPLPPPPGATSPTPTTLTDSSTVVA